MYNWTVLKTHVYLLQATVELTGEHTRGQMVIEKRIGDIYVPKC